MLTHEFDFSNMQLWRIDGTPVKLGDLKDIQTFEEPDDNKNLTTTFFGSSFRVSMTGIIESVSKKMKNFMLYGWKAKGPVRKRMLDRARYMSMPILLKKHFIVPGIKA